MHKCKYCDTEFVSGQKLGSHLLHCDKNPNLEFIRNKASNTRRLNNPKKVYQLHCKICNNIYELNLTEKQFLSKKYKQTCSTKCSRQLTIKNTKNQIKTKIVKCINCGTEHEIYYKNTNNYICENCKILQNNKNVHYSKRKCLICGQLECKYPFICGSKFRQQNQIKKYQNINRYFNINLNLLGNEKFIVEYFRVQKLLYNEYIVNKLSMCDISKKYNMPGYGSDYWILDFFNIERRSLSDANKNAILHNKNVFNNLNFICKYPYKHGYHITWDNKEIYYRSSYELEYAKQLDNDKISYDVENLRIEYWDSQQKTNRIAIPDFYVNDTSTIIEIKSNWTYDEQNMKDRFLSYKQLGYNTKLILDKKEINCDISINV